MSTVAKLKTLFHADLSDAHPGEDYFVSVAGKRIPLVPHTPESLAEAVAAAPALAANGAQVTHYTNEAIELPADLVIRVHLRHTLKTFPNARGKTGVGHSAFYIPPLAEELQGRQPDELFHSGPINYVSTARTFISHHQDLVSQSPQLNHIIQNDYMVDNEAIFTSINNLAIHMRQLGNPTETGGWAKLVPFEMPADAHPKYSSETHYNLVPAPSVMEQARPALAQLLILTQNNPSFRDKKWSVQPGNAVVSGAANAPVASAAAMRPMATIEEAASGDDHWSAAVANLDPIDGCKTSLSLTGATRQIELAIQNRYIRYLAAYIEFFDATGASMNVPNWTPDDAGIAYELVTDVLGVQYDNVRYLGLISPVDNIIGIPITGLTEPMKVKVTFPEGAVSATVYGSGLGVGHNPWPLTPVLGGVLTGVMCLGVPAFMLAAATAAQSYKPLYDIIQTLSKKRAFQVAIGVFLTIWVAFIGGSSIYNKKPNWTSAISLVTMLFSPACKEALVWVEATMSAEEVVDQIPFAGWIMLAINIITGLAQMAETIVDVATSDWNIPNQVSTTITTTVTVHPDPRNKAFPQGGASAERTCIVKMTYKDQTRPTVSQTVAVQAGSTAVTLVAEFAGNTLGGQVKFEADFYVDSWLAGKATTGYLANDEAHVATVDVYLVEFPVPLTSSSVYSHAQLLTYAGGNYGWTVTDQAPTATITSRNMNPVGNAIGDWTSLCLSQRAGMIGLAWEAAGLGIVDCDTGGGGQLHAFQNIDIPGTPMDAVKFPSCGFSGQTRLIYDPYPPKFLMKDGAWVLDGSGRPVADPDSVKLGDYYIDPRSADLSLDDGGGFHLRKIVLDTTTPFDMSKGQLSHGRFPYFPDSLGIHPSGLVIGVSAKYQKLQIVTLDHAGAEDADTPIGKVGSGPAMDQTRPGLMFHPVGVTCAYDGTIIVLEDSKSSTGTNTTVVSRLSAYDLHMNPVSRFFDETGKPSPWLYLSNAADYYYLDVTAVGGDKLTYIYILYYTGSGATPSNYHMAIYTYGLTPPASNPLVTTDSIAAAKVCVDMWHTAYTLNFPMVTNGQGQPAGPTNPTTGPAGRTVPSVSMWLPPVPSS